MSNKLVKSLLVSGLGLIGLTVALLGVGKAVAGQQKAELDEIATEFLSQFPVTQTNDSARELDRLISGIRVDGTTFIDVREATTSVDGQKAKAFQAASGMLTNYLERQVQKPGGPLEPLPAEVTDLLLRHKAELDAIKQHLATAEAPVWVLDPEVMANEPDMTRGSFLNLVYLNDWLLVDAIAHSQNNQPKEMLEVLAIAQKLYEPLTQRPDLYSHMFSLPMVQRQAGVLRHLDGVPAELAEQLLAANRQGISQQPWRFDTWIVYKGHQKLISGEILAEESSYWEQPSSPPMSLLANLKMMDTTRVMNDYYPQLEGFNVCNPALAKFDSSKMAWWNDHGEEVSQLFAEVLAARGSRRMLELELTQKVLQAKAQKQGGKWPAQLSGLKSQVCPGEAWAYEVTPEGKMSLAFSYEFEDMADEGDLPLRYEGE